jgi:hypothetical protein
MRPPVVGQQSVAMLAEATGGGAEKYTRAEFFQAMRERLKKRVTLSYCVEKRHAERVPRVSLSDAAVQKLPNAELRAPGMVRTKD